MDGFYGSFNFLSFFLSQTSLFSLQGSGKFSSYVCVKDMASVLSCDSLCLLRHSVT